MKKTKRKILDTALILFNTKGLAQVTLRNIATEMGISQGNLNYHFKKREEIIEGLYYELVDSIDQKMGDEIKKVDLGLLFEISSTIMNRFYDYRFFFIDFVQIIRENENIKTHYTALTEARKAQFSLIFGALVKEEIIRPELLENEYAFLYNRLQILGDFWISSAMTDQKKVTKKTIATYSEIIKQSIYPYLTEKGREAYHSFD